MQQIDKIYRGHSSNFAQNDKTLPDTPGLTLSTVNSGSNLNLLSFQSMDIEWLKKFEIVKSDETSRRRGTSITMMVFLNILQV